MSWIDERTITTLDIRARHDVPIQESPHLARLLYQDVKLGQEIPADLFQAVSIIFAQLDRFRGRQQGAGV